MGQYQDMTIYRDSEHTVRSATLYRITLPLDCTLVRPSQIGVTFDMICRLTSPATSREPSGENASALIVPLLFSRIAASFKDLPSQSCRYTFWSYIKQRFGSGLGKAGKMINTAKSKRTSPPTATIEPFAATAVGTYFGFSSKTF